MTQSGPKVHVHFEPRGSQKIDLLQTISPTPIEIAPTIHLIQLRTSFGVVRFSVDSSVFALVNGEVVEPLPGPLAEFRIRLDTDFESHVVQLVMADRWSVSIHLAVHHHMNYKQKYFWPKWTKAELALAHIGLKEILAKGGSKTRATLLKVIANKNIESDFKQARIAAHLSAFRLSHLLARITQEEWREAFGFNRQGGIDIRKLMLQVKSNSRALEVSSDGPFIVGNKRYTTTLIVKREQKSTTIDRSALILVLEVLRAGLIRLDLAAASQTINKILSIWRITQGGKRSERSVSAAIKKVIDTQTHSGKLAQSKELIMQLLLIINQHAGWDRKREAQLGLEDGWRDFDVFQNFAAVTIQRCLGSACSSPSILSIPHIHGDKHDLINPNIAGGQSVLKEYLNGWRDHSLQKSDYRPDLVILYNKKNPILVDAKYRMSNDPARIVTRNPLKKYKRTLTNLIETLQL